MSTEPQKTDLSAAQEQPRLLREFSTPTYEDWVDAAVKLLKGAPFEKKLYTKTYEGITLQPMYRQEDLEGVAHAETLPGFAPYVRGSKPLGYKSEAWDVAQEIPYSRPAEFNAALKHDLENGQTTINLILDSASQQGLDPDQAPTADVGRAGVSIATVEDLEQALADIDLEETPLVIQTGPSSVAIAAFLAAIAQKRGQSLEKLRGSVAMDPLASLAVDGTLPFSLGTAYTLMAGLTSWAATQAPQLKTIAVQGIPYHNSGCSAVQELAFVMATAVEYLRKMQQAGLAIDDVAPRVQLSLAVSTNYFMEVAKLRAARLVWAKIINAFGGNAASQNVSLHTRTSSWNKTLHDPYVNMLRTTVESFASVIGGCNSLHVGCFDEPFGLPDEFSRRIARNTHTILKEEVHLHETVDPAGGSWYVEKLTDQLAREVWTLFQEIEAQGGMTNALQQGIPQSQTQEIAAKRKANLSTRKDVVIGTNMYPNLSEKLPQPRQADSDALKQERSAYMTQYRITQSQNIESLVSEKLAGILATSPMGLMEAAIAASASGATLGDIEGALRKETAESIQVTPLNIHRGAEMFEQLRAATEAYQAKTGERPTIFMANMGPIPQHKARADFSVGFFEVGGFSMLKNDGFSTVDEAAQAAIESGAPAVIICSTDATYPEIVPDLTQQIKAARPETMVILAGYPKEHVEAFQRAGVDEFIHIRANLYDILVTLMQKIQVLA